jgi:4-amino-4-deoxy-L-arabinose transferase-like glycosyltransferase
LACIVLLAALLRFPGLDSHPPGLFRDEAEKGYNAWAIAQRHGALSLEPGLFESPPFRFKSWPWMIVVDGSRTSALYQYFAAPFVSLGGLNVVNTRRPAALAGTLAVVAMGLAALRIWGAAPGLLIALWLAISPWHIVFSRWAQQSAFVPLCMALAFTGCWGHEQRRRWGLPLLGAALGLLFYDYSGAQPFVLAWGGLLFLWYLRGLKFRSPAPWLGLALFALFVVPTLVVILGPGGSTRLSQVAIWSGPDRNPLHWAAVFVRNYLLHFSPGFLFVHGDLQPRHAFPGQGAMLWVDALLLPLGVIGAFRGRLPLRWPLLFALLCGPLPAAITKESPHALRAFPQALPAVVFAALGLWLALGWLRARLVAQGQAPRRAAVTCALLLALGITLGLNAFARYWHACDQPLMQLAFQSGMREAWQRLNAEYKPGQRIFFSVNFPYAPYFQLYYQRLDPLLVARKSFPLQNVFYFNPAQVDIARIAHHGDWVLTPVHPLEPSLLENSGLSAQRAMQSGEYWTLLIQNN